MKYYNVVMTDYGEIIVSDEVLTAYGIRDIKAARKYRKQIGMLLEYANALARHEYLNGRDIPRSIE